MENKKKTLQNFNFRKKKGKKSDEKKKKKIKKEGKVQFVINYHTPFHEPNNSNIL